MEPQIPTKKELYLSKYPYDRNVFIMMKYSTDQYHTLVERNIRRAFEEVPFFNPVFAKDITPDYFLTLPDAIRGSIEMCRYGIAIFTLQEGTQFNPNVAFELGMMWDQTKDFLVLKDRRVPTLFTNIAAIIYEQFDGEIKALRVDANELYSKVIDWLGRMKGIQEDSLNKVFVTGLEHIIENPARAMDYFEEQMWICIKTIAGYAHLTLPQSDDLHKAIKFLYDNRQLTTFISVVMLECVKACQQLREVKELSIEQRNRLLGWASLIRDIYNDWLRHHSHFLRLRRQK